MRKLQTFKGLRAGNFMNQMSVDVENRCAILCGVHHMGLPEFVVESLCHGEIAQNARR